jgi:CubicO group peptidase (beta-lactamase class C family)
LKPQLKAAALAALIFGLCGFAPPATQTAPATLAPATPPAPAVKAAEPAAATAAPQAATGPHALTAEDAGAWFDGLVPDAIARGDIAGAVVVVVKDGQVLMQRGYGYADLKTRRPVDPETTLFRPGSVSKLFAWTAVMQQVQAGKIDLDADINTYLDFKIPPRDGKPITMRQLMTHSAGFSDAAKDLIVGDPKAMKSTESMLKAAIPARIYPPGQVPAYSNYGASLAGYVVQRVSGEPFDQYVQTHIFNPLGMTRATFTQPLPDKYKADMALGYRVASGPPGPYELVNLAPAGSLAASGADMARFMIAHLQDGTFNGQQILDAKTAQLMHSPQFRPVASLGAMDLGFYQEPGNGHRVIGHAGDTENFHSDLHLYLDDHVGLFLSFNSAGAQGSAHGVRSMIFKGFTDRYIAAPLPQEPTWKDAKADGQALTGRYIMSRRSDSGWLRLASYAMGQASVSADKDGVVTISAFKGPNGKPKHWREVGPFAYREVGGDSRMGVALQDGKPFLIMTDDLPPVMGLMPVAPVMSAGWNHPLMYATLFILTVAAFGWPLAAFIRWRYRNKFALSGRPAMLYRLTRLVAVIDLASVGLWFWYMTYAESSLTGASSASDGLIRGLQLVGLIGCAGSLIALANAGQVLVDGSRSWFAKLSSVLIAAAALAFVWFQFSLGLITLKLAY